MVVIKTSYENFNYCGCGFVDQILYLFKKEIQITSLDNLSRKGSKYNLEFLKKKIKNLKIDIQNYKKISKLPKYDLIIGVALKQLLKFQKIKLIELLIKFNWNNYFKKVKKDKSKIILSSQNKPN